jgi:hypothetical protein
MITVSVQFLSIVPLRSSYFGQNIVYSQCTQEFCNQFELAKTLGVGLSTVCLSQWPQIYVHHVKSYMVSYACVLEQKSVNN